MSWIVSGVKKLWTGYSDEQQNYYESKLIYKWGGITPEDVKIKDIPISSIQNDSIHSISISTGSKVPLILIPGYGASGGLYYKLMKKLSLGYDLYVVDMRGMGW